MKVTYSWLKDFVEIKISPQALADKLTMAGLEVTSLEEKNGDYVFEIEVTSNRPDWLSVIGIAREVAAITGKSLKIPQVKFRKPPSQVTGNLLIKVENKKDCPLYTAKIIKNVKVGPSPDWLKKRIELIGCRSVNNIVDITNYVLFEYGEPLHAFDLDKLRGNSILVRRAKSGEKITVIDGGERELNPEILVIADQNNPVAIAGVMGGKYCEVNESTKSIFLEAALFNPILVRRARRKLGLQSESAYRFERGVDTDSVHQASYRALDLIQKLGGGDFVLAKAYGLQENKSKKISLSGSCVEKILGIKIAPTRIKRILDTLGFRVKAKSKDTFTVEVPTHRQDVDLEVDLIEEIARIHGYETIPESLPAIKPQITVLQTRDTVSLAKKILVGMGLNEVITYSLIGKDALEACAIVSNSQTIGILNPLSKEQEILRPSLIFGLANCVAYNLNQQQEYVNIFEIAKVFSGPPSKPREELVLGVALCGTRSSFISGHGLVKEETVFLHLKGILERLFVKLAIKDYSFRADGNPYSFAIYVAEEKIGILNKIEKSFLDKLDIKNKDLFILEVSLDKIFLSAQFKKKFVALPKYPAILRDISFIMKDDILTSEILEAAKEKAGPLLCEVKVADFYKGKQIPDGYRGLTISCLYRSEERTLTEAEINPLHNLICGMLTECFGVKLR